MSEILDLKTFTVSDFILCNGRTKKLEGLAKAGVKVLNLYHMKSNTWPCYDSVGSYHL